MNLWEIRNLLSAGQSIFDLKLRVTYYARVSTDKEEQAHSLTAQVTYYEEYIRNNPNWTYVKGYYDEGISGTTAKKRDSFMTMINDAKEDKFDFIITKEISRFSRNTLDSIKYTQELLGCGVGVFFQSDNINTLSPDAELRLTIMSSIAQDEVRKLSERCRFGFKRSIEKGVVLGSNSIWGYKKDHGKLVIVEEEAQIVRLIFDLYVNKRLGVRRICNELTRLGYKNTKGNPFSYTLISNIIRNPKYKGYYCGNKTTKVDYRLNDIKQIDPEEWVMYKDEENVPPLVSEEMWDKANELMDRRAKTYMSDNRAVYNSHYSYSGKVICMEHNSAYWHAVYHYATGDKELYQCKQYTARGRHGCRSPVIYKSELDDIIRQCYRDVMTNKDEIADKMIEIYKSVADNTNVKGEIQKSEIQASNIRQKKDKLLELSLKGILSDDEFAKRNGDFNKELETIEKKLAALEDEEKTFRSVAHSIDNLKAMILDELDLSGDIPQQVVDSLVDRIEVYPTGDANVFVLKVYLKVLPSVETYRVSRKRRNASVCTKQCT